VNRFASTLILAAAPLLAVGMVTQSESASVNSTAGVSSIARNSDATKQSFRGYWLDGSNFTQDAGYSPEEISPQLWGLTQAADKLHQCRSVPIKISSVRKKQLAS
jgi:hypothetical protein